jgi:hypothetical protein
MISHFLSLADIEILLAIIFAIDIFHFFDYASFRDDYIAFIFDYADDASPRRCRLSPRRDSRHAAAD